MTNTVRCTSKVVPSCQKAVHVRKKILKSRPKILKICPLFLLVTLPPTKRACGQVGHLKRCCPNVRRHKLLILSYLQMFKRFPSAETKVQNNYRCSITYVRPTCHKPMLAVVFILSSIFLPISLSVQPQPNQLHFACFLRGRSPYILELILSNLFYYQ